MNSENSPTSVVTAAEQREFAMGFTSSPRGACLARKLVSQRLDSWGLPYTCEANQALTAITGEFAANAVRHGHAPGRDIDVRLTATEKLLRIEVSDSCDAFVQPPPDQPPSDQAESGRGLLIVAALATRWAVAPRTDAPGKTFWAEVRL